MSEAPAVLNGKKAILAYLGRSSNHAWQALRRRGLPVYHEIDSGRVWAIVDEVEAWRRQRSRPRVVV